MLMDSYVLNVSIVFPLAQNIMKARKKEWRTWILFFRSAESNTIWWYSVDFDRDMRDRLLDLEPVHSDICQQVVSVSKANTFLEPTKLTVGSEIHLRIDRQG